MSLIFAKYEDEFRKVHPETVGETDQTFDRANYQEWLDGEVTRLRATLSRVEAERDGLRATLSLVYSDLDRAWRSGVLPADVIPSETARRIVAVLTTTEGEKP